MPSQPYRQNGAHEHWLHKVFFRAWLVQEALAFAMPILIYTAGRLLYRLIPHRKQDVHISFLPPTMHATGGTPEEIAPLQLAIAYAICQLFALVTIIICFLEILLLKSCCCGGCLNPISYAILNFLQCLAWVWASGQIGGVLWQYESYMHIHLLEEPIWWAAFLLQIIYGLAFLIPALASIRSAARVPTFDVTADEERRPLIVVVEGRRDSGRNGEVVPSYGT